MVDWAFDIKCLPICSQRRGKTRTTMTSWRRGWWRRWVHHFMSRHHFLAFVVGVVFVLTIVHGWKCSVYWRKSVRSILNLDGTSVIWKFWKENKSGQNRLSTTFSVVGSGPIRVFHLQRKYSSASALKMLTFIFLHPPLRGPRRPLDPSLLFSHFNLEQFHPWLLR